MWLITTFIAAVAVSAMHFGMKGWRRHGLNFLALMLWGTFVMVLVDHVMAFVEGGGEFIEVTTEGFIASGLLLGVAMLVPLVLIWMAVASSGKLTRWHLQ